MSDVSTKQTNTQKKPYKVTQTASTNIVRAARFATACSPKGSTIISVGGLYPRIFKRKIIHTVIVIKMHYQKDSVL